MIFLLYLLLVLVPYALFVALFKSKWLKDQFVAHGTRSSLACAAIGTTSRVVLFGIAMGYRQNMSPSLGDLLEILLVPDYILTIPIAFLGGCFTLAGIPIVVMAPYFLLVYFIIFRLIDWLTPPEKAPDTLV